MHTARHLMHNIIMQIVYAISVKGLSDIYEVIVLLLQPQLVTAMDPAKEQDFKRDLSTEKFPRDTPSILQYLASTC